MRRLQQDRSIIEGETFVCFAFPVATEGPLVRVRNLPPRLFLRCEVEHPMFKVHRLAEQSSIFRDAVVRVRTRHPCDQQYSENQHLLHLHPPLSRVLKITRLLSDGPDGPATTYSSTPMSHGAVRVCPSMSSVKVADKSVPTSISAEPSGR